MFLGIINYLIFECFNFIGFFPRGSYFQIINYIPMHVVLPNKFESIIDHKFGKKAQENCMILPVFYAHLCLKQKIADTIKNKIPSLR